MNKTIPALLTWTSFLFLSSTPASSQTTPFLSDDEIRMLVNEISGDRAYEHIRRLTTWHRDSGMEGYFEAARYVVEQAKKNGLEDVRFVEQPLPRANYTAHSAELWMLEPVEVKLADIGDHALFLADGSSDADVTAELVWIGDGSMEGLDGLDVEGKIVLTSGGSAVAASNAVFGRGALGVVAYPTSEGRSPLDFPDQVAWDRLPPPVGGQRGTFAFVLSPRMGDTLRRILQTDGMQDYLATGTPTRGGRVVVHAEVDTEIGEAPGRTGFVEGWIRGSKYHDQQIVITAHLQEEQGSANDDGSGCGNILELARVFDKLIEEGKIERPLRDIRFWWTDEIYSEYRYFQDHPEETRGLLANLHQDMTGARQSMGSRVQHLIFEPFSRTSYLDAMFESIGTFLIHTNNSYLAAGRQGGHARPHSRGIYAARGSREGYNARFVPFFGSSDHTCFLDGPVGVHAVGMVNWDDDYIHSSDDDLPNLDQTQLERNNFLIGAMAYRLAFAEADDVPLFVGETFAQGERRLARDMTAALALLGSRASTEDGGWKDASMVVEQGIQRELRGLSSVEVFAGDDEEARKPIVALMGRIEKKLRGMLGDLEALYRELHGTEPPAPSLTDAELAALDKVPANVDDLDAYFTNRSKVGGGRNLHDIMRGEVFNFVDGERTYYDIYRAVRAEALVAGEWYYGTVSLDDVVALLDAAVGAGALVLL